MKKIKSKKKRKVNADTLIATVDVGKEKNSGYYRCPDGRDVSCFEFANHRGGFDYFWSRILKAKKYYHLKDIVIGFESTGSYGEPLVHYFRKKPVRLVQVNPMHTKRVKELSDNSPNKTDRKDPRVIADIIQLGHALSLVVPEGPAAELRRLTHGRERSMQRRTALLNQLQQLVFVLFPEFLQVMKGVKSKTARYLLQHYPTPQDILNSGVEALSFVMRKISRGHLGEERARVLYGRAKNSAGIKEGRYSLLFEIKNIMEFIEGSDGFIAEIEQKMSVYLKQIPCSRLMLSMKGVGTITAAGLIGEVGDFSQFGTISEITKLAGLDLYVISSGKRKGHGRISKRGRSLMRKLLFFTSINVVRKGGILHEHYQRYLDRGMLKKKALVAISRKLLRIIFAMVRDHREYDIDYLKTRKILKEAA
jgi:transposase